MEREKITHRIGCVRAVKDDDGNLTIGKFAIAHDIGSQRFEDTYYKHINDMNKKEKEEFEEIKQFFR